MDPLPDTQTGDDAMRCLEWQENKTCKQYL
jgi:hypothetical protein